MLRSAARVPEHPSRLLPKTERSSSSCRSSAMAAFLFEVGGFCCQNTGGIIFTLSPPNPKTQTSIQSTTHPLVGGGGGENLISKTKEKGSHLGTNAGMDKFLPKRALVRRVTPEPLCAWVKPCHLLPDKITVFFHWPQLQQLHHP